MKVHISRHKWTPVAMIAALMASVAMYFQAHRYLQDDESHRVTQAAYFDPTEHTIDSIHTLLSSGEVSCRQIVQGYLKQIETFNRDINAILTLNEMCLQDANELDKSLRSGLWEYELQPLFCIPILLKDNYDTADMPTTAGSTALRNMRPKEDAPVVRRLKSAGAIILGKTNMHEFALEGLSVSSLGGQTHNPYDLGRTPGGSSGGSGAAVATSFSTFATASDTVNSIRSPAASNSLFGIRPTRGLISRAGVVPVSYTQDAIGPIARTVPDLAIALEVMVGEPRFDFRDNLTVLGATRSPEVRYSQSLTGNAMSGVRIGILRTMFSDCESPETAPVKKAMSTVFEIMENNGAVLIDINNPMFNSSMILEDYDVQAYEFPSVLTAYLQSHGHSAPFSSFDALYASREFLPLCHREVLGAAYKTNIRSSEYAERLARHSWLSNALHQEFLRHNLTAIIYPEQQNLVVPIGAPSQKGRNGILAAITGSPVVVVPAGFSPPTDTAPIGLPIGMEILGLPWTESTLLDLAYSYDLVTKIRQAPVLVGGHVDLSSIEIVPEIIPDRSVHEAYLQ